MPITMFGKLPRNIIQRRKEEIEMNNQDSSCELKLIKYNFQVFNALAIRLRKHATKTLEQNEA